MKTSNQKNGDAFAGLDIYNPAPRCPVSLVLDCSGSMNSGNAIGLLNEAVRRFIEDLKSDECARLSVELEIILFADSAEVAMPFTPVSAIGEMPPDFIAAGMTALGKGLELAERDLRARRELYRAHAVTSFRPWIVVMADGGFNQGDWRTPAKRLREQAEKGKYWYFGIEIGDNCDHGQFREILPAEGPGPVKLRDVTKFSVFFKWLSDSLKVVSASQVSQQDGIRLPSPLAWAQI